MNYTVEYIRRAGFIIFEAKMGSHAYGTNIPTSDIDIRGIFIQPLKDIIKYGYVDQVSDETNDTVYYELKRFLYLTTKNNPNILELLNAPSDCVLKESALYHEIKKNSKKFVTKSCRFTFAGYAIEQIKKARGYNKKINWEEAEMTRKGVLDFCYILEDVGSIPFSDWIQKKYKTLSYKDFALAKVDHAHDTYAMYRMKKDEPSGIVSDIGKANDVQLFSIPKGRKLIGYLTFNKDAYSTHCKRYKEYKEWLKNRNEDRFKMNKEHGKNYDSKNMMHTFRLLKMALEIAESGSINVRRSDEEREKLLKIRHGEYEYDDLIREAEEMIHNLDKAFEESSLPSKIDREEIAKLELTIRSISYGLL
jgi:predicted nucleotidyltransferase